VEEERRKTIGYDMEKAEETETEGGG